MKYIFLFINPLSPLLFFILSVLSCEISVPPFDNIKKSQPSSNSVSISIDSHTIVSHNELSVEQSKDYDDEIFKIVEEMPLFPGCEDIENSYVEKKVCADTKLLKFIQKNIWYPKEFGDSCISGHCIVTFVVEKNGIISNMKLIRDLGGGAGKIALHAINEMVNQNIVWTPGKQNGQPVRVQFILPIRFCIL